MRTPEVEDQYSLNGRLIYITAVDHVRQVVLFAYVAMPALSNDRYSFEAWKELLLSRALYPVKWGDQ